MNTHFRKWIIWILIIIMLLAVSGCNQPGSREITDEEMMVLARLTVEAGMTQTAALKPPEMKPTDQSLPPATEKPPAQETPEATATITETPTETLTPTLSNVMASVSVDTNCRSGPGEAYTYLGALMEGEEAEVIGKDKQENFWVIENPDASGECWIWGQFATVEGPKDKLPVRTPPPTPTPEIVMDFLMNVNTYGACGPNWYIELSMANVGNAPIESVAIEVENTSQAYIINYSSNAPFVNVGSCMTSGNSSLLVGQTFYINIQDNAYLPPGDNLKITATVCSADNQDGVCATGQIIY